MSRGLLGTPWLALQLAAASCSGAPPEPPVWVDLSRGFVPQAVLDGDQELVRAIADLDLPADLGATVDGRWRVRLGTTSADAIVVLAGTTETIPLPVVAGRALTFDAGSEAAVGATHSVLLSLDSVELDRFDIPAGESMVRRIVLPPVASGVPLSVRVDGPPGFVALCDPVIGPAEIGTAEGRPWPVPPDIALLIADTFRADNLEVGGGEPRIAPALNEFARGARCFVDVRAPATWTLPSHAAIFAARYPAEIAVLESRSRLGDGTVTLARHLRRAGYRTAAVTDAGYVSSSFGLDQGFEWFEELGRNPDGDFAATERAFERILARDDGRPLFVFVHSYRAHSWVVDEVTRERLADRYEFLPNEVFHTKDWRRRLMDLLRAAPHGRPMAGKEYDEVVRAMIPNYRGASADAARGFAGVIDRLRDRGTLRTGVVVFTSDHGESFGTHGVVSHGNGVWDEQALVPLVISSTRWSPGVDRRPVSGLDVPRTLCGLAGIDPHAGWGGVDLSAAATDERSVFVFQTLPAKECYVAAVVGGWKWIFLDEGGPGELAFAYSLADDPQEANDRAEEVRGGAGAQAARDLIRRLYVDATAGGEAVLSATERDRLRALGYAAGDDGDR